MITWGLWLASASMMAKCSSEVPGGVSIIRVSNCPQATLLTNWDIMAKQNMLNNLYLYSRTVYNSFWDPSTPQSYPCWAGERLST